MSDIAIRVENLSKRYRIGMREEVEETFVGAIGSLVRRPAENLKRLRNLSTFDQNGKEEEDVIWALKDVSFEVPRGEVLGVIGRNGAGKSTLLKILSSITYPTSGRVELNGRVASLLEVGTGFHQELTGRENIYLNGTILGMTKGEIDKKFDEIVDFSGVEKFIDTPVKRYSSGMRVRLAFSVAAHLEPEILLVDEVLAVGDAEFQKKCLGKMGEVAGEGRTVLFVSHNIVAVESLCNSGILIDNGEIVFNGEIQPLITAYLGLLEEDSSIEHSRLYISEINILDDQDKSRKVFRIGEPIKVLITIDSGKKVIKSPVMGIGVNTEFGQRVFTVGTYFSHDRLPDIKGKAMIICEMDTPKLVPGDYHIKIGLGDIHGSLEQLEQIANFSIEQSDIFGNGRLPAKNKTQGFIIVPSRWNSLNSSEASYFSI